MSPDNTPSFSQHLMTPEPGEYMPATTPPFLNYKDLIMPKRFAKIVEPNEIPVHPDVYLSPQVYTKEFVAKVAISVPGSIRQDVVAITRTLGVLLGMEVTSEGIVYANEKTRFEDFNIIVSSGDKGLAEVEVAYGPGNATNIALVREGFCKREFYPDDSHPMPKEKLKAYGHVPGDYDSKLPTWYIHNLSFAGFGGLLYFRNFAIMFNNLGLKELGNKS